MEGEERRDEKRRGQRREIEIGISQPASSLEWNLGHAKKVK